MIETLTPGKGAKDLEMKYKGILAHDFETKELVVTSIHANKQISIVMQPIQILQGDHPVATAIFHARDLSHHLLEREKDWTKIGMLMMLKDREKKMIATSVKAKQTE